MQYVNKNGVRFIIQIEDAPVPPQANYWGFRLRVKELATAKSHTYRALLVKETFPTKEAASIFVNGDPIQYLKTTFLDNYSDGSADMVWPVIRDGWVVT